MTFIFNELTNCEFHLARPVQIPLPEAGPRPDATPAPNQPTNPTTNQIKTMSTPTNYEVTAAVPATDDLDDAQLEAIAGGFLHATLGSSVHGDGMLCIGGGLINSKMELNL